MECDDCNLCCKLLPVPYINKNSETWCKYYDVGCTIYGNHPDECKEYMCMWLQMEVAKIEMRPDKSHIIFDKISDKTICAVHETDFKISNLVMGQIKAFNKEGFSVVVFHGNEKLIYKLPQHDFKNIIGEINDRSKLHRRLN